MFIGLVFVVGCVGLRFSSFLVDFVVLFVAVFRLFSSVLFLRLEGFM